MEKMTNAKALKYVVENFELPTDVAVKIDNMIASYEKKSSSRKPTKVQKANEEIKVVIKAVLSDIDSPITISEMLTDPRLDITNQKATALLRQLIESNEVVRTEEKGRAYFALA